MVNYQIFISYRRDGGDALAGRLADRFNALGYKVFYDVESMRSGTFNTQILDAIAQCNDVLLVLPPKALDRCINEDDWVRQELSFALKHKKNIIPVIMRGFEFPKVLPLDIDNIRNMEGVTASSEYFDAVIDRIQSLLTSTATKGKSCTKFPVYEDANFSEDVIMDIIYYHLLKNPIPENRKNKVNQSLSKYYNLNYADNQTDTTEGIPGREILHTVQYGTKMYNIYDVFYYNDEKYAYGLEANINPTCQQVGTFFSIDENDNIKLILSGTTNAIFSNVEIASMFSWYTKNRRGLGGVPDIFLPLLENQMRNYSINDLNTVSDFVGLNKQQSENVISNIDKTIYYLKTTNENLLYPRIRGIYKKLGVVICDGNCYGNSFQGFYAGKIIKTPIKKSIILDIVPTMIKNHYIALVYGKTKKKGLDYLIEGPEYYLITKDERDNIDFCKISDDNLEFLCGKYFERFALIYMQTKLQILNLFLKQ